MGLVVGVDLSGNCLKKHKSQPKVSQMFLLCRLMLTICPLSRRFLARFSLSRFSKTCPTPNYPARMETCHKSGWPLGGYGAKEGFFVGQVLGCFGDFRFADDDVCDEPKLQCYIAF